MIRTSESFPMFRTKFRTTACAVLCLSVGWMNVAAETTPLTLAQAQRLLLSANPDLRIEQLGLQKANAQVTEAQANYWPSLDVSGSYQALTEKNHISITLPPPSNAQLNRTMGDFDREEYGIDLSWPLFGGGARYQQVQARKSSVRALQAGTEAQRNQLALRLAALYCAWQMADAAVKSQADIVLLYQEFAEHVNAQVKQGAALKSQAATARARWLGAQVDWLSAQDTRDSLGRAAALLLGISADTPVVFAATTPASSGPPLQSPSETTSLAAEERPDMLALDYAAESFEHQQRGLRGQRLPTLVGMVGYRIANPGLNLGSTDYMNYGVVGLQAKWNLFDGFRNRSQREQLQAQQASTRIQKESRAAAWTEAERSAERRIARLEMTLQATRAALEAAEEDLREKDVQLQHGAIPELERIDAQVHVARTDLQVLNVTWHQALAEWQQQFAKGETLMFPEGE